MSVEFLWRLPIHGDGRRPAEQHNRGEWRTVRDGSAAPKTPGFERGGAPDGFKYIDHLAQIARAAEINGFHGALVPAFRHSEEPWMISAALARETRHLHFLIAIQPWFIHPGYAAQMAASLQRISGGRVEWNVITGGGGSAQRAYGDFIDHDSRYARTDEFLDAVKGFWKGFPFDFEGKHYRFEKGGLEPPLNEAPLPKLYLAGGSDAALRVSSKHAAYHLIWSEPLQGVRETYEKVQRAAAAAGRTDELKFAMRVDIFARETEEQAWAELRRLYESVSPDNPTLIRLLNGGGAFGDSESVGAQRQAAWRKSGARGFDDLTLEPNYWSGMSLLRGGPGGVIVGSYEQAAERLAQYVDAGVSSFILASNPHLEEAYRVGEEVLPLVDSAIKTVQRERAAGPARQAVGS
jgi:alkanesulfonate monooxygenase